MIREIRLFLSLRSQRAVLWAWKKNHPFCFFSLQSNFTVNYRFTIVMCDYDFYK